MNKFWLRAAEYLVYASLASITIVGTSVFFKAFLGEAIPLLTSIELFFPFIMGKALFFRTTIELAALSYLFYLLTEEHPTEWEEIKKTIRNPLVIAITTFTAAYLIASFTAVNSQFAIWSNFERGEGAIQLIHYWAFFVLSLLVLRTKKDWMKLLTWFTALGVLVSYYAVGQHFNFVNSQNGVKPPDNQWINYVGASDRVSGTLGNPLYLATLVLFLFFYLAILIKENGSLLRRGILIAIFGFEFIVFFMPKSRNSFLGLIGGLVTLLWYFVVTGKKVELGGGRLFKSINLKTVSLVVLGLTISIGSIFYLSRTVNTCHNSGYIPTSMLGTCDKLAGDIWPQAPIVNRFAKDRLLSGLDDRTWVWGAALAAFIEKPILGWGPENFPTPFDKYYNPKHFGNDSWFDRAHDIYLEYLTGGGLVLFFAYLAIWVVFFREIIKRRQSLSFLTLGLSLAFAAAYLIQGISAFEVLPIYLSLYVFFGLIIRLMEPLPEISAGHNRPNQLKNEAPAANYFLLALAALAIGTVFYFANYLPYQKNHALLSLASARNSNAQVVREGYLKELDYYSPIGQQESVQYYLSFVLATLQDLSGNPNFKVDEQNSRVVSNFINEADSIYEKNEKSGYGAVGVKTLYYDGRIFLTGSNLLQKKELLETARKRLEEGLKKAPTRMEFIYGLLDLAAMTKDKELAKPLIARAKALRPDLNQSLTNRYEKFIFGETK